MSIEKIRETLEKQKRIAREIANLSEELQNSRNEDEREVITSQIRLLKEAMQKASEEGMNYTEDTSMPKPLTQPGSVKYMPKINIKPPPKKPEQGTQGNIDSDTGIGKEVEKKKKKISNLEKLTLKRMKKKEKKKVKKVEERKASSFVKVASSIFGKYSLSLTKRGKFHSLERDLIRANMEFVPMNYISVIFMSTLISVFVGFVITIFFLFFNVGATAPFVTAMTEPLLTRLLKVFWIFFLVPVVVYLFAYFYPSMERKSLESKINNELPFATIHMSSISSSMIEPSNIFTIIMETKEYPNLEKEFTKLLNEVNIYGYDLVTALRDRAFNSPSRKLADLYNGLATTITSGGDLPEFFAKRSQTLLFEHGIETEKHSKTAETFMDVYISVVIAAPMILMLLLVMMSASGLGLSLSTGMISLVMVLAVTVMNILFLAFLQMKQPGSE